MDTIVEFRKHLDESTDSIIKAGYVDISIIDSLTESITRCAHLSPNDAEKIDNLCEQLYTEIHEIPNKGGSEEIMADFISNLVTTTSLQEDICGTILLEEAYEIYKKIDIYSGRLFTASLLNDFYIKMGLDSPDESDREKAIQFLKENLDYVEKHDGRKDDYYHCIESALASLNNEKYLGYMPDLLVECFPSKLENAKNYYLNICNIIRLIYNKHTSSSDPEHNYWFETYLKFLNTEISYREKESENAMFYGLLNLGTLYSVEYSNTGNIDYYNNAKQALQKICRGENFPVAQSKLKSLEVKFSKKQENK